MKSLKSAYHCVSRIIFLLFFVSIFSSLASAKEYQLAKHSIRWTGSMPTQTHTGLLIPKSSKITIDDNGLVEHLEVALDMSSIDVTDLEEGKMRKKLINHLKSEDFFYAEKYPVSRFVLKQHKDSKLVGEIEIRGVTKPITIPVEVTGDASQGWTLRGNFDFDRQDFNVNYQNGGFFGVAKDKLIRDEVNLNIVLKVTPNS